MLSGNTRAALDVMLYFNVRYGMYEVDADMFVIRLANGNLLVPEYAISDEARAAA